MAQGWSAKIISVIKWIRISTLSIQNSLAKGSDGSLNLDAVLNDPLLPGVHLPHLAPCERRFLMSEVPLERRFLRDRRFLMSEVPL